MRSLLLVMLLATPALAGPLERLASEDLLDTTRAELVSEACAAPSLPADALAPLFLLDRRTPPIDAARIATCRSDPALLPLMFSEFARSSLGAGASTDPDIFEQLLRGMQAFPLEVVRLSWSTATWTPSSTPSTVASSGTGCCRSPRTPRTQSWAR